MNKRGARNDRRTKIDGHPTSFNCSESFKHYQAFARRAAKDLQYGIDIVNRINMASSANEITLILHRARLGE